MVVQMAAYSKMERTGVQPGGETVMDSRAIVEVGKELVSRGKPRCQPPFFRLYFRLASNAISTRALSSSFAHVSYM